MLRRGHVRDRDRRAERKRDVHDRDSGHTLLHLFDAWSPGGRHARHAHGGVEMEMLAHVPGAWRRRHDPALWLSVSLALPYLGMLAYFALQIARAMGLRY
jgi:hypothetical protein